ncbi:MarR family transcriptional regulator [Phaeacidiphilus oryzae]|uniref:MarR family transcriptional regulator n=1 Tax=Phaeacidiphilus oryzae TaxID=348818 RepID=UPI000AC8A3D7|nr:MarR family transcriptional regulator [Phaeacidiphilus oryzae]
MSAAETPTSPLSRRRPPAPEAPARRVDPDAAELRNSVMRLARRLRGERERGELSLGMLSVLGRLERDGAVTTSELAGFERVTPQSMTRTVGRLVDLGLVERSPDPADGRQTLLHITRRGRELILQDRERRDAWLARTMAANLTDVERDLLLLAGRLLDRLAEAPDPAARAAAAAPAAGTAEDPAADG